MKGVSQMEFIRSIRKHPLLLRHYEMDDESAKIFDDRTCAKSDNEDIVYYKMRKERECNLRETPQSPRNN